MSIFSGKLLVASYQDCFRIEYGGQIYTDLPHLEKLCTLFNEESKKNEDLCLIVRSYVMMEVYIIADRIHVEFVCNSIPNKESPIGVYVKKAVDDKFFDAVIKAHMSGPLVVTLISNFLQTPFD